VTKTTARVFVVDYNFLYCNAMQACRILPVFRTNVSDDGGDMFLRNVGNHIKLHAVTTTAWGGKEKVAGWFQHKKTTTTSFDTLQIYNITQFYFLYWHLDHIKLN
jgi:hypothetical protein